VLEMINDSLFEPSANNLDLYGGVGLFAAAVCARLDSGTSIRSVESALESGPFTSRNLERYPNAKSETQRVDRFLKRLLDEGESLEAGTVILDPPRKGAGERVIRSLADLGPAQVIYVACDPVALSRDLGLLLPLGYEIGELRALDLFPNTHHFETVASLLKAAG
ncbi:MAG: class I SAM-dependent RNA methyltransferase, partial [Cryobacterium sp.]|nr:class I SAM-dependent RNA methyltransferase [Cryobacterium sp.]